MTESWLAFSGRGSCYLRRAKDKMTKANRSACLVDSELSRLARGSEQVTARSMMMMVVVMVRTDGKDLNVSMLVSWRDVVSQKEQELPLQSH